MKLGRYIILVLYVPLLGCDGDDYPNADIPSVVVNTFRSAYPEALEVEWKSNEAQFEAEFEARSKDYKVAISQAGQIFREKKDIMSDSLPVPVQWELGEQYGLENISDAEVVSHEDQKYYQVEIERFLWDKEIVINAQGKVLDSITYWD